MAVNNLPLFSGKPSVQWNTTALTTANTGYDGTGAGSQLIFAADATYGSYIDRILVQPLGTLSATTIRIFLNDGNGTAASNFTLMYQLEVPAYTSSNTDAMADLVIVPEDGQIPPGSKLYATTTVAQAAGLQVTVIGGHYIKNAS